MTTYTKLKRISAIAVFVTASSWQTHAQAEYGDWLTHGGFIGHAYNGGVVKRPLSQVSTHTALPAVT